MFQFTINISDKNKIPFIIELFNNFDFASIEKNEDFEDNTEKEIIEHKKKGFEEIKSTEEYNQKLLKSEEDIKHNRVKTQEEFETEVEKWLKN